MTDHSNQLRCYELITETTRLRMVIEDHERVDSPGHAMEAARLWAQYHRAMVELLALTPAHDAEAARRQEATAKGHEAMQRAWRATIEQLEGEGEGHVQANS